MNLLERYQNGEHEQVWEELQKLGADINNESYDTQAKAVAAETMRRVRENCERIISRLEVLGYIFGTYPDGTKLPFESPPHLLPSEDMQVEIDELEAEVGALPLSLKTFWQEVGAVDLIGMHPSWPDGLDPLVVSPPEVEMAMLYEMDDEDEGKFTVLAPDDLHKDNVSGGDPYGVMLPNDSADFKFLFERHNLYFVQYLRLAILDWGGFPGLDEEAIPFEPLETLTSDLVDF